MVPAGLLALEFFKPLAQALEAPAAPGALLVLASAATRQDVDILVPRQQLDVDALAHKRPGLGEKGPFQWGLPAFAPRWAQAAQANLDDLAVQVRRCRVIGEEGHLGGGGVGSWHLPQPMAPDAVPNPGRGAIRPCHGDGPCVSMAS